MFTNATTLEVSVEGMLAGERLTLLADFCLDLPEH